MNEKKTDLIQKELAAIKTITEALSDFEPSAQHRILKYSLDHLNVEIPELRASSSNSNIGKTASESGSSPASGNMQPVVDIRSLATEKKPKSDSEMAAVMGFYLSELAPAAQRKAAVTTEDVKIYFKQANFPLPEAPRYTLPNALKAGYFDKGEYGTYKLNPVGYNLVAHSLPLGNRDGSSSKGKKKAK